MTDGVDAMTCFEVSLNGKEIARVGHPDAATLLAVLEATPSVQAAGLELTGESRGTCQSRWKMLLVGLRWSGEMAVHGPQ